MMSLNSSTLLIDGRVDVRPEPSVRGLPSVPPPPTEGGREGEGPVNRERERERGEGREGGGCAHVYINASFFCFLRAY